MTTELYDLYDSKGKVMRLYQELRNGEKKQLLSFTLNDTTGPCHERSVEEGSYEVNGSKIIFYTLLDRRGNADAPYGARIATYTVDENGELILLSSKIYIETERRTEAKKSAMQYLFTSPVTQSEKEALRQYVESAEKRFKGTFVFGEEARSLIKEVNEALQRKMQKRWH
ncbi:hypothetical protein PGH07_03310 [Sulfurovum sp. zt1-1]|uniref:Uncharacterized protein n=2 Tax=Sulfurovum zhangzhouensis TaxID=3019067 RepID=A0ABT7QWJ3_9BACT|nr:hypothetical protein [Sulfurovum zhangzhouensis]